MLACCAKGYELGFRTFVLQGGEDGYFNDDQEKEIIDPQNEKSPTQALFVISI